MSFSKKIFIFIVLSFLLTASAFTIFAAKDLEVQYPTIPGVTTPVSTKTMLPDYVEYIFRLAISISGLVVFGVIIYAGFLFLTAGDNPTQMEDAKDRIFNALVGLIVLLGSYIILTTINPQLVILPGEIQRSGVELHSNSSCGGNIEEGTAWHFDRSESDIPAITRGMSFNSIEYLSNPGFLDVFLYSQTNFEPEGLGINPAAGSSGNCFLLSSSPLSMKLDWKTPGVYLYEQPNYSGSPKIVLNNVNKLDDWDNKIKSIKLKPSGDIKFGAVLHENEDYKGQCKVFLEDSTDTGVFGASSVSVFSPTNETYGEGVTLCKNPDCEEDTDCKAKGDCKIGPLKGDIPDLATYNFDDKAMALVINGNYIAVLFRKTNYKDECQIFFQSFPNLLKSRVAIKTGLLGLGSIDSISSLKIIPIRK